MIIPYKTTDIGPEELTAVTRAMEARQLSGSATIVRDYEHQLAQYFQVRHALVVSSGTAAMHLLLYLYDIKAGDEVIVSPLAPINTVLPILAVGAKPVFVDVQANNYGFDLADLEAKTTSACKAIVTSAMWGYPIEVEAIKQHAAKHSIPVIENAADAHGALYQGKAVGTLADVSFFSTSEDKLMTTGEGGFILTNNDFLARRVRSLRDLGRSMETSAELSPYLGQAGYLFGLNYKMPAMSAALGMAQLRKLNSKLFLRKDNAYVLQQALKIAPWLKALDVPAGGHPNYSVLALRVEHPSLDAAAVVKALIKAGIYAEDMKGLAFKPLYDLPIFARYPAKCSQAERLAASVITLPTHEGLTRRDIEYIADTLYRMGSTQCVARAVGFTA